MKKERILITGANGQIGTVLTQALRKEYGEEKVLATDIRKPEDDNGPFELLDVLAPDQLAGLVKKYQISQVYHLAAILSAKGEKHPKEAWEINMKGLFHVLDLARKEQLKVFFPSSIAVFGGQTQREETPQLTILDPETVYGISKVASEYWCQYYFKRYGVDVRSVRFPGIIGYESLPGGGTTDYAVEIYHYAVRSKPYTCFLSEHSRLPMMYMPDAIRSVLELMAAPAGRLSVRTSYNLAGMSFSPLEVAQEIQKHLPGFQISYKPDFRQAIADSWPGSIDDRVAREDWGWKPQYDLASMTEDMLYHLKEQYKTANAL